MKYLNLHYALFIYFRLGYNKMDQYERNIIRRSTRYVGITRIVIMTETGVK